MLLLSDPLYSNQDARRALLLSALDSVDTSHSGRKSVRLDVLELKEKDILDVLKIISEKSGLNIVAGPNIQNKITIYLKDVDARDALKMILVSNGLACFEDNGIIRVMTAQEFESTYGYRFGEEFTRHSISLTHVRAGDLLASLQPLKSPLGRISIDEDSNRILLEDAASRLNAMEATIHQMDVPVETEVFSLNYATAEEMTQKVKETLTQNIGRIKFDAHSNKIVVSDTPQKIKELTKVIQAFDEKGKEVSIEAKILAIELNDEHAMGVDWEAIVSDYHSVNLETGGDIPEHNGRLSVGTISREDFDVLLEALDTVGQTNMLSSPRITAINNEESKILVGSTEPYVTTTTTTPTAGPTTTSESVNFIEVGVRLFVTPTVHPDDFITMKIRPEVSSVSHMLTTNRKNSIPVVNTSQAETTVNVKNNATVVIGGLIKEENVQRLRKIPLLGDLPFVGFAFRNQAQAAQKTEIVIFLTPVIVTGIPETETKPVVSAGPQP